MFAAVVCDRFGWTLDEFDRQPWDFIETIQLMLEAEAIEGEANARRTRT